VASYDLANIDGISNAYLNLYQSLKGSKETLQLWYRFHFQTRNRGLFASLTNRFQWIINNHESVAKNSNVTNYVSMMGELASDTISAVNRRLNRFISLTTDSFDSIVFLLEDAKFNVSKNIRGTLSGNLMTCYPRQNANYTSAIVELYSLFLPCFITNDRITSQLIVNTFNRIILAEIAMNLFNSRLWACSYSFLSGEQSNSCVNDLVSVLS
jgi:hypothetical protein